MKFRCRNGQIPVQQVFRQRAPRSTCPSQGSVVQAADWQVPADAGLAEPGRRSCRTRSGRRRSGGSRRCRRRACSPRRRCAGRSPPRRSRPEAQVVVQLPQWRGFVWSIGADGGRALGADLPGRVADAGGGGADLAGKADVAAASAVGGVRGRVHAGARGRAAGRAPPAPGRRRRRPRCRFRGRSRGRRSRSSPGRPGCSRRRGRTGPASTPGTRRCRPRRSRPRAGDVARPAVERVRLRVDADLAADGLPLRAGEPLRRAPGGGERRDEQEEPPYFATDLASDSAIAPSPGKLPWPRTV